MTKDVKNQIMVNTHLNKCKYKELTYVYLTLQHTTSRLTDIHVVSRL